MFRLTLLLCLGLGATMMVAGRDLTPEERAARVIDAPLPVPAPVRDTVTVASLAPLPAPQPAAPASPPIALSDTAVMAAVELALATDRLETPAVTRGAPFADDPRPIANADPVPAPADAPILVEALPPVVGTTATAPTPVPLARIEVPPPQPAPVPDVVAVAAPSPWYVNADRVNLREGPSTDFAVIGRVVLGDAAEMLSDPEQPWVRIRVNSNGSEGYIARRFLQQSPPNG